jgi:Rad3-related DNA helicase
VTVTLEKHGITRSCYPAGPDEKPIDVPDITPVFAPGGPIARLLGERYRYRQGQVEMAQLVRQALVEGRPAVIEAGTGCGKSFAYLVPLIWSGARAIVSTANKTLQTQLWEKDIPALRQIAPRPFTAALLKGRSNYICLYKLGEARKQLALPGLQSGIDGLLERLQESVSGDVEEMRLFGPLREAVTAAQHECLGQECPYVARCYYEQARALAEKADIVVINHALLAYNLIRPLLLPRPVIVIDEAHELERYVIGALRLELEHTTVFKFINDTVVMRNVQEKLRQETVQINHMLFDRLSTRPPGSERRWAVPGKLEEGAALARNLATIHKQLLRSYRPPTGSEEENIESLRHQVTIEWARNLAEQALALANEEPPEWVRYCEEQPGRVGPDAVLLCLEPLHVGEFLHENLFAPVGRVICTGATLAVGNSFDYFCRRVGVPAECAIERVIASPFDYPDQALLYIPQGLEPRYDEGEDEYLLKLGREIWRLVQASRGRAFVLCTSTRRMRQLYELVSPHLEYNCYCQGEDFSRAELLDLFRNDPDGAVLFATRSFWEGVDIPGEALSLVIIDKLPFAPHQDPVNQRRQQLILESGGDPFNEFSLPEAILTLKQGVGRLIRSETDRGVMAILDSRLNTKSYGRKIISSLPPARRTWRLAEVQQFFAPPDAEDTTRQE